MKPVNYLVALTLSLSIFFGSNANAQPIEIKSSAVWLSNCTQSDYFNTTGSGPYLIGPSGNIFGGANLGVYTANSGTLVFRGGQVRTFKTPGANICEAFIHYRIYPQSGTPGTFNSINLFFWEECDPGNVFPSGGFCGPGNRKWDLIIPDGTTVPYSPVDLTTYAPGNYVLEVYYELKGSSTNTTDCNESVLENNGGANYKATFSIQSTPVLSGTNPTGCSGTDGSVTISGLTAGATYAVSYSDGGVGVGPNNLTANGSGAIIIGGLNAGSYTNFSLVINGCSTNLASGVVLAGSMLTPTLTSANPSTCNGSEGSITVNGLIAGTTYSITYTDNGVTVGPANFIANGSGQVTLTGLNAGTYSDFEIVDNGCTVNLNTGVILSNPVFTPTFNPIAPFCAGSTPPTLPTTSANGITGTWSPSVIDNQTSGSYTFTPTSNQCAIPITRNVTVNPMVTPTFSFGTSLSICAGASVPTLPNTSSNGITGSWSPSVIDNQNSATYTFTPTSGQCANATSLTVSVTPNVAPTFSFGSSLSICAGGTVPTLPTTSDNGVTGTWSPATVDNQNSGTYTFTPTSGVCATTATFTVTVTPNATPVFSFGTSLSICPGGSVPALPTTSDNAITGTWSPATIDNQNSGTYTFTPTPGLCAVPTTFSVTVNPNITPTFSFGTALTICAGGTVPALPASSTNGITGTWSPATVDNMNSGSYTFTPDAGQCATTATFTVTVNPNVTPVFSFGTSLTICSGATAPTLPTTSDNAITGTWSPATVDNQNSGTYTFTPTPGVCATTVVFNVTVSPNVTPVFGFGSSLSICPGGTVPGLPTTSDNAITGSWSPATVDNQNSGTYTFTPTPGLCATTASFTVTVNQNITPTFGFGTSLSICAGGTVPALANTSDNGITGSWSPSVVDDQNSGTYTFTPDAGQCALQTTFTVTVNPIITPTFSFGTTLTVCAGATVPALPTTSSNNITGTWSPATVDNQASGTYTFTPTAGQCATNTTFSVTVNSNTTPTFSFGATLTICAGGTVPALPNTSDNGINGTWSPAIVNDQASGTYTFTPDANICALPVTFTVTVNPNITPAFSFGPSLSICEGGTVPALVGTSSNGITGTWSPATVDNMASGSYTFTPDAGLCATTTTFTVTVNPIVTPVFGFGTSLTICSGTTAPALPTTSDNGITGAWSPATIDNQASGTYTFAPTAGQCATTTNLSVTVTTTITPQFGFGPSLVICEGGTVPTLPTTSDNGIDGIWNPAVADNQASAVYTFTPTVAPGQCIATTTFTITVNPILTPTFNFGTSLTLCAGSNAPALPNTSTNGINGTWSPATIDNQASGTYTFTSTPGQCATETATLTVTVNPVPTVASKTDITVEDGTTVPLSTFSGTPNGVGFNWTNSNTAIGLAASGTGNVPSFTASNMTDKDITATITVTPTLNNCTGAPKNYLITVKPLDKDIFVPNVFSPNGDGKNDVLMVYGNYIDKIQLRIFNQWGQQIYIINSREKGWDGTHRGKAQPVGVYVYELQAVMTDGRTVKLKGSITLLR